MCWHITLFQGSIYSWSKIWGLDFCSWKRKGSWISLHSHWFHSSKYSLYLPLTYPASYLHPHSTIPSQTPRVTIIQDDKGEKHGDSWTNLTDTSCCTPAVGTVRVGLHHCLWHGQPLLAGWQWHTQDRHSQLLPHLCQLPGPWAAEQYIPNFL